MTGFEQHTEEGKYKRDQPNDQIASAHGDDFIKV
jgi:hypothetical protein